MTKRIVSGIFILTALGALGVILAGALTSGEQLIVRFLTAVIVAALGLYVISDLRLQADDDAMTARTGGSGHPRLATVDAPPNSTAAFMATVTRRTEPKPSENDGDQRPDRIDETEPSTAEPAVTAEEDREDTEVAVGPAASSTTDRDPAKVEADAPEAELELAAAGTISPLRRAPNTVRASDLNSPNDMRITDLFMPRNLTELTPAASRTSSAGGVQMIDPGSGGGSNGHSYPGFGIDDPFGLREPSSGSVGQGPSDKPADGGAYRPARFPPTSVGTRGFDSDASDRRRWEADAGPVDYNPFSDTADLDPEFQNSDILDFESLETPETTGETATPTEEISDEVKAAVLEGRPPIPGQSDVENSTVRSEFDYSGDIDSDDLQWPPPPTTLNGSRQPHPFERVTATFQPAPGDHKPPVDGRNVHGNDDLPVPTSRHGLQAGDYADAPLAPIIDLRNVNGHNAGSIDAAIGVGELEVIATLIEQGMLSTEGPISDRDVRTMVYVAFTSNELRKLLLAGGSPDGPNHGLDLGPVELFDERIHAPAPKRLYSGIGRPEPRSQLG